MLRLMSGAGCFTFLMLLGLASSQAQTLSTTLSGCRPSPPMPPNVKPGVGGLTLSRDGKTLVVTGGDGKIRFVDMASRAVQKTLTGHTNMIYKAIFSPDEKLLASSSRQPTLGNMRPRLRKQRRTRIGDKPAIRY